MMDVTNQIKVRGWLKDRQLVCEENFGEALYHLAVSHSKKSGMTMMAIWKELGVTKQNVNFLMYHHQSITTKLNVKRKVILNARDLFSLSTTEIQTLASKAGLKMFENNDEDQAYQEFSTLFTEKIKELGWKTKLVISRVRDFKSYFLSNQIRKTVKEKYFACVISCDEL